MNVKGTPARLLLQGDPGAAAKSLPLARGLAEGLWENEGKRGFAKRSIIGPNGERIRAEVNRPARFVRLTVDTGGIILARYVEDILATIPNPTGPDFHDVRSRFYVATLAGIRGEPVNNVVYDLASDQQFDSVEDSTAWNTLLSVVVFPLANVNALTAKTVGRLHIVASASLAVGAKLTVNTISDVRKPKNVPPQAIVDGLIIVIRVSFYSGYFAVFSVNTDLPVEDGVGHFVQRKVKYDGTVISVTPFSILDEPGFAFGGGGEIIDQGSNGDFYMENKYVESFTLDKMRIKRRNTAAPDVVLTTYEVPSRGSVPDPFLLAGDTITEHGGRIFVIRSFIASSSPSSKSIIHAFDKKTGSLLNTQNTDIHDFTVTNDGIIGFTIPLGSNPGSNTAIKLLKFGTGTDALNLFPVKTLSAGFATSVATNTLSADGKKLTSNGHTNPANGMPILVKTYT